jgi:glycosyltransferase involved in cell wall biosynthesis
MDHSTHRAAADLVGLARRSGLEARALLARHLRRQFEAARREARRLKALLRSPAPAGDTAGAPDPEIVRLEWAARAPRPWGDPLVSAVAWQAGKAPAALDELLAAVCRQSLGPLEIVVVARDGRTATRIDPEGRAAESWPLESEAAIAQTLLGKYVCLLEPSFAALPSTYLEENALALEGHDLDFTVNGLGPAVLLEGALLEGRLPDTAPGQASRPLLVFRAECLGQDGAFDPHRLRSYRRDPRRLAGRGIRHDLEPGAPFESPAEWRRRLAAFGDEVRSNGREIVLGATANGPVHAGSIDLAEAMPTPTPVAGGRRRVLVSFPFLAVGGAEKLTFDVLERLRGRFDFVVITVEPSDASLGSTASAYRKLTPHVYQASDFLHPSLNTPFVTYLIRKLGAETLFVPNGSNWFYDALPVLKGRFPGLRVVNQVFDHNFGWINRYTPDLAALIDAHLAPNQAIADAYRRFGAPRDQVHLIHHGIDLAAFDPAPYDEPRRAELKRSLGLPAGPRVVSFIARLHPQKRPTDFLRLADRFREDREFTFLMVGDGPAAREVSAMAAQLKLPNLRRLPFHEPVQDVIAATDVLVIPSEYEGLPLVLLNCLAMGVPAVSTDVGCIREVLTDEIGAIVRKVGDVRGLEAGVRRVARMLGPDLRESARQAVAAGHDIAIVAEQYARALEGRAS